MPHFFLELRENEWSLIRETASSQKFKVKTPNQREMVIDVHYTMPKILSVSISSGGPQGDPGRYAMQTIMDELAEIALKTGNDYAVIDYTLTCGGGSMMEGNYTIDKEARRIRKL